MAKIIWKDKSTIDQEQYNAALQAVKSERDRRLFSCDWIILRHNDELASGQNTTLTAEQYQAWLEYRQSLRDMPNQPDFDPYNPVWPPEVS